ncbi:dihydropteroate synthase [Pedobacter sp.]|uniref:dihydropteroate synthase n=1 Tax=Pedobacter sp. TaxID=1411316 RepID=UPI0031E01205
MAKDTFLNRKQTLNCKGKVVDISQPSVMAILNLTPDSFYQNSRAKSIDDALGRVEHFVKAGAKFIDLGAYSSRPGAAEVSEEEELQRMVPTIKAINESFPEVLLSVDTFRAKVAEESIHAGAHLVNDIAAGNLDEKMFETVAKLQVPYIMMHMKGTPQNMQDSPTYENITKEVFVYFNEKIKTLQNLGVKDIILDPGFGFAKTLDHNYQLLKEMELLNFFELPLLVGFSRKSMITKALGIKTEEALNGTTVLNTTALLKGANILRVHDVKEAVECVELVSRISSSVY